MAANFNSEFSGLRCAGGFLIFLGIVFLPEVYISIPALTVGCMVGCCTQPNVSAVKQQAGCAKCCSVTGIVCQALAIIGYIAVGALLMTTIYAGCQQQQVASSSCRRSLLDNEVVGPMTTFDIINKQMPGYFPELENGVADALAQFVDWRDKMNPPALFHEVDGVPVKLPLPDGGRMLTQSSDTCNYAFDGDCDDGGFGSEHSYCESCTDYFDCGCNGCASISGYSCFCSTSYQSDGACDDGGPGSTFSLCPLGRDPEDCGTRTGTGTYPPTPPRSPTTFATGDGGTITMNGRPICQEMQVRIDMFCSQLIPLGAVVIAVPTVFAICFFSAFGCVLCKLGNIERMPDVPVMSGVAMAQPGVAMAQPVVYPGGKV